MKPSKIPSAFTLVEVIVSMTILGIIMVSVMVVFISGSNTANKIDIQRGLQENVKNIVETIAEDIRKNGINMCSPWESDCMNIGKNDRLFIWDSSYFLASKVANSWVYVASQELCRSPETQCFLVKNSPLWTSPLSNSQVAFDNMNFIARDDGLSKVTISFQIYPAFKKWVPARMIIDNKIQFQTTVSDRLIKNEF